MATVIPMRSRNLRIEDAHEASTKMPASKPHINEVISVGRGLRKSPLQRNSLSTIKLALAVVTGDGVEVNERIQQKVTILDEETPAKPFKRSPSAKKLYVKWPPSTENMVDKKRFVKNASCVSPNSASATTVPMSLFSTSSKESSSQMLESLSSTVSSLSDRDISGESDQEIIGRSVHVKRQGIKEKIDIFETWCQSKGGQSHLNCPLKLRETYLDDSMKCSSHEDIQEYLAGVSLSPGHNLPKPKGCKKHRRVSYHIRFGIPNLEDDDDDDDQDNFQCDGENIDFSTDETKNRGRGGIRGINRPSKWVSCLHSGMKKNKIDMVEDDEDGSCTIQKQKNELHHTFSNVKAEILRETRAGTDESSLRPDVWVTPIKSKDGSQKWIAKRVWNIEDMDDEEPEYEVDHLRLMDGIRGLLGIPEGLGMTSDEWQVDIDESDPWEIDIDKDSTPISPRRTRASCHKPLSVPKVIDVDGEYEDSSSSLMLDRENDTEYEHTPDTLHLKENTRANSTTVKNVNRSFDLGSDSSMISLIDYFCDGDASSVSVSLPTQSTGHSHQLPSEGGLDDYDEAVEKRINTVGQRMSHVMKRQEPSFRFHTMKNQLQASLIKLPVQKDKASTRFSRHNEEGSCQSDVLIRATEGCERSFLSGDSHKYNEKDSGRSDSWETPADKEYYESLEGTKCIHHNERGFGRPDSWVRPVDEGYSGSSEYNDCIHYNERNCDKYESPVIPADDTHEISAEYSKNYHHRERGFGRPDEWVRPVEGHGVYSECRSSRSPIMARMGEEKTFREISPEENFSNSTVGCSEQPSITHHKSMTFENDSFETRKNVNMQHEAIDLVECTNDKHQQKKETTHEKGSDIIEKSSFPTIAGTRARSGYESGNEHKRGIPTWEKRALQQCEVESNIKLWWEF